MCDKYKYGCLCQHCVDKGKVHERVPKDLGDRQGQQFRQRQRTKSALGHPKDAELLRMRKLNRSDRMVKNLMEVCSHVSDELRWGLKESGALNPSKMSDEAVELLESLLGDLEDAIELQEFKKRYGTAMLRS